jgi:hypothetical protein
MAWFFLLFLTPHDPPADIGRLANPKYRVRLEAFHRLEDADLLALPALVLGEGSPDLDTRRRCRDLKVRVCEAWYSRTARWVITCPGPTQPPDWIVDVVNAAPWSFRQRIYDQAGVLGMDTFIWSAWNEESEFFPSVVYNARCFYQGVTASSEFGEYPGGS